VAEKNELSAFADGTMNRIELRSSENSGFIFSPLKKFSDLAFAFAHKQSLVRGLGEQIVLPFANLNSFIHSSESET
jgi:hypothetical protein